jgi:hypothetical protein
VRLKYGSFDEKGCAVLSDQEINTKFLEHRGFIKYSLSERKIERIKGVDMEVFVDKDKNILTMRDDPDSTGFNFPLQIDIFEELKKVKAEFEKTFGGVDSV